MHLWALILFFHVGAMGDGNSNATSVVQGFQSKELCEKAAAESRRLVSGTVKEMRAICVQTQ